MNGRGNVDVIQQPTRKTATRRSFASSIMPGGSDNYRVTAYWENYSNGDLSGTGVAVRADAIATITIATAVSAIATERVSMGNANQGVLHWSGNVDGELEIRIQNGRVSYRNLSGAQPTSVRADAGNMSMPRYRRTVSVAQGSGPRFGVRYSTALVEQRLYHGGSRSRSAGRLRLLRLRPGVALAAQQPQVE